MVRIGEVELRDGFLKVLERGGVGGVGIQLNKFKQSLESLSSVLLVFLMFGEILVVF